MKTYPAVRIFITVFIMIFVAGNLKSYLGGYRPFCQGINPCNASGEVIPFADYITSELLGIIIVFLATWFITYMGRAEFNRQQKSKNDSTNEEGL